MPSKLAAVIVCLGLAACRRPAPLGSVEVPAPDVAGVNSAPAEPSPVALPADRPFPPPFIQRHYLDPDAVARISRFRSGVGHDFSDGREACRSMKHYLQPHGGEPGEAHQPPWTFLALRSPVDGRIEKVQSESPLGDQVWIAPNSEERFRVRIFHVRLAPGLAEGSPLVAGQLLGHHASEATMSDIALEEGLADGSTALHSYFAALSEPLRADLAARGVADPAALVIARSERDAAPLSCGAGGEAFDAPALEGDWVNLSAAPAPDAAAIAAGIGPELNLVKHAGDLPFPVALAFGPAPATAPDPGAATLFVATNGQAFPGLGSRVGKVFWLDGETPRLYAQGLDRPLGLLFVGQGDQAELLISSRGKVAAWTDPDGDGLAEESRVLTDRLPGRDLHQNDSLALGPDGLLYGGMGTKSNAGEAAEAALNGTVYRLDPAGGEPEVHASGMRNPFDLAFDDLGRLWATDNGVDPPVREDAPEELNLIVPGGFYGHPGTFGPEDPPPDQAALGPIPPVMTFPGHASANGILAYGGAMFPELWGGLIIAEFGSYYSFGAGRGQRLVLAMPGPPGAESGAGSQAALIAPFPGRPLDLVEDAAGRIFIADFEGDAVWRLERRAAP